MNIVRDDKLGITEITCSHIERKECVVKHSIELEPLVLFLCCAWCMARIQKEALINLLKESQLQISIAPKQ